MNQQAGATLIESVVALFVFAVGALGLAALQTTTLVRSDDVKQRSVAIWKAQELADRIKATRTIDDPNGLAAEYATAIGVTNRNQIGVYGTSFSCPNNAPTRCDDQNGTAAASCTTTQLVQFDVWSVLCDPRTGAAAISNDGSEGLNKLKDLDVALVQDGTEYLLYFEWASQSGERNEDVQASGTTTIETDLCDEADVDVDSRLNAYCLRF